MGGNDGNDMFWRPCPSARLATRDERTVKFFSSSPVLIRWNSIWSSPDPQNFWKSSVQSSPDPPE